VEATVHNGAVTLRVHKRVLLRSRQEDELRSIASKVYGVESVAVKDRRPTKNNAADWERSATCKNP
jgi:hypothetical protein